MATKKSSSSTSRGRKKVEKVMHEYKHGQLKSGGRKKVKNPKQAIAIALSEARASGANIPKKGAAKKKATKKAAKKTTAKRSGGKKTAAKKKSTARKRTSSARKSASR